MPQGGHGSSLLGNGGCKPVGGAIVGREGEADDAIGLRRSGSQHVQIIEPAPEYLGARAL